KAGVKVGDVITHVGEQAVHTPQAFREWLQTSPPGTSVKISLLREERASTVAATLAATSRPMTFTGKGGFKKGGGGGGGGAAALAKVGKDNLKDFDAIVFLYAGDRYPTGNNTGHAYAPHIGGVTAGDRTVRYLLTYEGGSRMNPVNNFTKLTAQLLGLPSLSA